MTRSLRRTLLSPVLTAALLAAALVAGPLAGAPPAAAQRLGPGEPPMPGFSGYTAADGSELGIGRLPDGHVGVCLDTGPEYSWPRRTPRPTSVTAPVAAYLASVYLPRARHDAVTAAALWWALGRDLRLNSHPSRVDGHLDRMRSESPALFARVTAVHDRMLLAARRLAAPRRDYRLRAPSLSRRGVTGTVGGVGITSRRGRWLAGLPVRVTLTGATFAGGSRTWRGTTPARPLALGWHAAGGATVRAEVVVEHVPAHRLLRYDAGPRTQRVAASPGLRSLHAQASLQGAVTRPVQPRLTTAVTAPVVRPGQVLTDAVTVLGTGGARVEGEWRLLGPVGPGPGGCPDARWSEAPVLATGRFRADGDGTLSVGSTMLPSAGCYTYSERLLASGRTRAVAWTPPGIATETALARSRPSLTTHVDRQRATAGDVIADTVLLTGMPDGPAGVRVLGRWRLLGPAAPTRAGSCGGLSWRGATVAGSGTFIGRGDGSVVVGRTRVGAGGCYTYRESLDATTLSEGAGWTPPGTASETTLVTPRQPHVPARPHVDTGGESPGPLERTGGTQVQVGAVGLRARLTPVRFHGDTLSPPDSLSLGGVWADGASLDALVGTTVLLGHVSDDHDAPGAFRRLLGVRRGDQIRTTAAGTTTRWRVISVRSVPRDRLPRALFGQQVRRRLVLVTCTDEVHYPNGGFHYRRNLVVEAAPR